MATSMLVQSAWADDTSPEGQASAHRLYPETKNLPSNNRANGPAVTTHAQPKAKPANTSAGKWAPKSNTRPTHRHREYE